MQSLLSAIHSENSGAKIYWVNVGALGYVSSRPGSFASYNAENTLINTLSTGAVPYTVIDWCSQVFVTTGSGCTITASPTNPDLLDTDGVHPSPSTGMPAYTQLILKAIQG